jgi:hypothetical protein
MEWHEDWNHRLRKYGSRDLDKAANAHCPAVLMKPQRSAK